VEGTLEIAFLTIFGIGLVLLVVTFIIGEIFDFGGDGGGGELGGDSPSPFSSRILFVFATAFGGFGYIGAALDWPVWVAALLAIGGGLAVAAGTFFLIVLPMSRQQGSTDVHDTDFAGMDGQVTSEIPAGGLGRVTVIAPTSKARVALAARSADGERIPFGATVRIQVPGPGPAVVVPVNDPSSDNR
jgi:hypothetical protein